MERIVIIDHAEHKLYIEDIDEEVIEKEYGGNEEDYIVDNYNLSDHWSWDYIISTQYFPCYYQDGIEVEFSDLIPE